MVSQAVILVGGKGSRLYESYRYTPADETPKPLVEVGGKPFLTYAINILKAFGLTDIVLLAGHKIDYFIKLGSGIVRVVETLPQIDKAVLRVSNLEDLFVLLNGDCLPILEWSDFLSRKEPAVPIKPNLRDAGIALVKRKDIETDRVSCADIRGMCSVYPKIMITGGLHVGTYQGLERARQYMDLVCFGE